MRLSVVFLVSALVLTLTSAVQYRGADFTSSLLLEPTVKFRASRTATSQPLERILRDFGVNLARIRVTTAGTYNLTYGLELAKRAKAVGMELMIDLFYGDGWSDPGKQSIPQGWATDLDGLLSQVYNYTCTVLDALHAQGTPPEFIQLGNEINNGLLWPVGRISVNDFTAASKLLHAGALAAHRASPSTKRVIHLASGWDLDGVAAFYSGIFSTNWTTEDLGGCLKHSDIEVLGFTFYPFWGLDATFENLNASMQYIVSTLRKDIMIVETGWPVRCDPDLLSEPSIPVNTQGQVEWINQTVSVLKQVHLEHRGLHCTSVMLGFIWWEPMWVANAGQGTVCADNLLVDSDGVFRSSMSLFNETY